ncbi:MAG: hypothetical protein AAGF88_05145 [Pseudomonadota bacterium]
MMRALAMSLLCVTGAVQAEAQSGDAEFANCIDVALASFERELIRNPGPEDPDITLLSQRDVLVCGGAGIQSCDFLEDRVACQDALRVQQDDMRVAILETLPHPSDVASLETHWAVALYPQLWALAYGQSAGPDCAGNGALMAAWCGAVETNRDLAMAIMTWQMARLLEAAPSAIALGWAAPAPPPQPVPRP